nr:TonB-dependent receptor plug domain-containing protein [uncultured Holophaga sp.]
MARRLFPSLTLALAAGCALFPAHAHAADAAELQDASDSTRTYDLEKVGVTAKRAKEKPTSPYATTESSQLQTEVITSEEIEAIHPQTAWDILEQVPGVEITFQGRQHQEFNNLRGSGSFGVILDGVYIGQVDRVIQSLPVDTIESVTVVRDATALTLGPLTNFGSSTGSSNAGFVIIKTKRSTKTNASMSASYGTFNAQQYGLAGGTKVGKFDFRLSGGFYDNPGKDGWNMQTRNASGLFRGGYTGESFEADLTYMKGHGKRNLEWGEILIPTGSDYSKVGTLSVSTMNMTRMDPEMVGLNLTEHWTGNQTTVFSYGYNGVKVFCQSKQNSYNNSVTLRHIITTGPNTFKAGIQEMSYTTNGQAPSTTKAIAQEMKSLFAEDEYRFLGGNLTVDGGIRFDRLSYTKSPVSGSASDLTAAPSPAYTLGVAWKPLPRLTVTGRFARTQNDAGDYQVSPDGSALPPEKRKKYEFGIQADLHRAFQPWVTAYYYDVKDQKTSTTGLDPNSTSTTKVSSYIDPTTGEEYDFVTCADVVTHGIEGGAAGRIIAPLSYKVSWSYTTSDDATTNASMSRHLASAALRYRMGAFGANVSAHYAGPRNRSSSPAGVFYYQLGDYTRVDANLDYGFKLHGCDSKVTLYGRNIGDVHYATRYVTGAYRDPGTQVGLQFTCSFF